MHKFLRAAGFSMYTKKKDIEKLLDLLERQPSMTRCVQVDEESNVCEMRTEVAPGLGISGPRWAEVIFTNKSGDRFVKELDKANLGGYTFYDAALAQPEQFLWTVFDDATAKKYHWDTKAPTCEEGYAFTAPTIAELAKLTNQPNLEQTVARYNGFVDAKKDDDFDKPAESLTKKIEQGPFHAVRLVLCVHNLTGGLAINDNAQVLGQDMKPIKGLYAAGETAGGLYVGNGMPRAIMPGRWAGEHAAAN